MNYTQNEFFSTAPSTSVEISTPDQSLILSPKNKRKGSASYWKETFDQEQPLIKEMTEKSIQFKKISGLLTIKRDKPNLKKKNMTKSDDAGTWLNASSRNLPEKLKKKRKKKIQLRYLSTAETNVTVTENMFSPRP